MSPYSELTEAAFAAVAEGAPSAVLSAIRTPDALHVATALTERAGAFVTNDGELRRLKAEGIAVVVLDDYV